MNSLEEVELGAQIAQAADIEVVVVRFARVPVRTAMVDGIAVDELVQMALPVENIDILARYSALASARYRRSPSSRQPIE